MTTERQSLEVLLVNVGTPREPTAEGVREFLAEFLADRAVIDLPRWFWLPILHGFVLRKRPARVAELYRSIWTPEGSPLRVQSELLARRLAAALDESMQARAVFRYGTPSLEQELRDSASRAQRIIIIPLFPQRTASSTGGAAIEVGRASRSLGISDRVELRAIAPDDDLYIEALRERVLAGFADLPQRPEQLLVSFHGIPESVNRKEGLVYSQDCAQTFAALVDALDWDPKRATLCFQSRFGRARWLTPATADVLAQLPSQGVKRVGVVTPGFLTDGLETLEELGAQGRESFLHAGGTDYTLVPSVADHPAFLACLQRIVKSSPA